MLGGKTSKLDAYELCYHIKFLDSLKNEPKLLPENQAKYKKILDRNGFKKIPTFMYLCLNIVEIWTAVSAI